MTRRHNVYVCCAPNQRWTVEQGGRTRSRHLHQRTALRAAMRIARRDHVELVIQARNGRFRSKDTYGRESPVVDTEH